ncbi:MAG: 30S ribosomal protein S6 [Longimicrobiaceae bacterium]
MREYEVVYIFDPSLDEDGVNQRLERFHALVADGGGGEVTAVDHWGKRALAYPIRGNESGYYTVAHFTAPPDKLTDLERVLKLEESLLRFLVVVNEGDLPTTPVLPEVSDDDDQDGDKDEEEE